MKGWENMSQSLNKRKNNNNKFDKSPENFQININNINIIRRAKTRRNKKCLIFKIIQAPDEFIEKINKVFN